MWNQCQVSNVYIAYNPQIVDIEDSVLAVWLAQLVKSLASSCVCSLMRVHAGGPWFNSRYRQVNQAFHPFGVDKLVPASAGG
jgi:hypothetical protein